MSGIIDFNWSVTSSSIPSVVVSFDFPLAREFSCSISFLLCILSVLVSYSSAIDFVYF